MTDCDFIEKRAGVPRFQVQEFYGRKQDYVLLIPVINEGIRIIRELKRAVKYRVYDSADIVICDGGSSDGSLNPNVLKQFGISALLVMQDDGGQGAQLRMGMWWALKKGYRGIVTIDGNNKDSIEDTALFVRKLRKGYGFVQGSRFIKGGRAVRTPFYRLLAVRVLHAPLISLCAGKRFTDTTNAFRGYSAKYLMDKKVQPFRDVFMTYELLAYLSVRAPQLGYRTCEVPVTRVYPKNGGIPTKISFFGGNWNLFVILLRNLAGFYIP